MNEEALRTLKEMLVWIRASSFSDVKSQLETALPDNRSKLVYQATDGSHTVAKLKEVGKMGAAKVAEITEKCVAMGLMEKDETGKAQRLFDLSHFGLLPQSEEIDGGDSNEKS